MKPGRRGPADRGHTWACSCGTLRLRGGWHYTSAEAAWEGLLHHQATGCTGRSAGASGSPATAVVASRPTPGGSALPVTGMSVQTTPGEGAPVVLPPAAG